MAEGSLKVTGPLPGFGRAWMLNCFAMVAASAVFERADFERGAGLGDGGGDESWPAPTGVDGAGRLAFAFSVARLRGLGLGLAVVGLGGSGSDGEGEGDIRDLVLRVLAGSGFDKAFALRLRSMPKEGGS